MYNQNLPYSSRELICRKHAGFYNREFRLVKILQLNILNNFIFKFIKINKTFAHSRSSFIIIYLPDKDAFISVSKFSSK